MAFTHNKTRPFHGNVLYNTMDCFGTLL